MSVRTMPGPCTKRSEQSTQPFGCVLFAFWDRYIGAFEIYIVGTGVLMNCGMLATGKHQNSRFAARSTTVRSETVESEKITADRPEAGPYSF